jgi:hypothetical protein
MKMINILNSFLMKNKLKKSLFYFVFIFFFIFFYFVYARLYLLISGLGAAGVVVDEAEVFFHVPVLPG